MDPIKSRIVLRGEAPHFYMTRADAENLSTAINLLIDKVNELNEEVQTLKREVCKVRGD